MKHIYIMERMDGAIKIGVSRLLDERIAAVQRDVKQKCWYLFQTPSILTPYWVESRTHSILDGKCIHGEWFDVGFEEAYAALTSAMDAAPTSDRLESMPPYETVIWRFKNASRLAAATGIPRTTILRWKDRGFIPAQHQALIHATGKKLGLRLSLEEIVFGTTTSEVYHNDDGLSPLAEAA